MFVSYTVFPAFIICAALLITVRSFLGILFSVAMVGFALARVSYLDLDGYFRTHAAPGESFWFKDKLYRSMSMLLLFVFLLIIAY